MVNRAGGEPACPPRRQVNANVVIGTTPYSPAVSTLTPVKWPVAATSSRRSLLRRASKAVRMSRAVRPAVVRQPPSMSSWRRRCESARSVVVCPGWPLSAQQLTHAPMHVIFSRSPGSGRRTSPLLLPHNVLSRWSPRLVVAPVSSSGVRRAIRSRRRVEVVAGERPVERLGAWL